MNVHTLGARCAAVVRVSAARALRHEPRPAIACAGAGAQLARPPPPTTGSAVPRRWHSPEKLQVAKDAFDKGTHSRRRRRMAPTHASMTAPLAAFLGAEHAAGLEAGQVLRDMTREQIHALLTTEDRALETALFEHADTVTSRFFGPKIHFRGLIEFSNVCQKACGYCGIRKGIEADQSPEDRVHRYTMTRKEIVDCAVWAYRNGYGSVMLQSGELARETRLRWLCDAIQQIKAATVAEEARATGRPESECRGLGIALSVGELEEDEYRRLRDAGAHRYLLRIETSNPDLYATLHPRDGQHEWQRRAECLRSLQRLGFQVGTGVMIGLPGQTTWDLAGDIDFFRELRVEMVGMGPYVLQEDTPVGKHWKALHPELVAGGEFDDAHVKAAKEAYIDGIFNLSTRMLALARVVLGNVNIAATTALQAINAGGREIALTRGANLMMPILTPLKYREEYQLYEGKPCIDEGASQCRGCLSMRVRTAGKEIAWNEWGDPPAFWGPDAVVRD